MIDIFNVNVLSTILLIHFSRFWRDITGIHAIQSISAYILSAFSHTRFKGNSFPPSPDIFGHTFAKKVVFIILSGKRLVDKFGFFFNIEQESIFTAVCHSDILSFSHSVNPSETLTLLHLITFKQWLDLWYFTWIFQKSFCWYISIWTWHMYNFFNWH